MFKKGYWYVGRKTMRIEVHLKPEYHSFHDYKNVHIYPNYELIMQENMTTHERIIILRNKTEDIRYNMREVDHINIITPEKIQVIKEDD